MVAPIITVFGATGFLGRRIVRRLYERGVPCGSHRGTRIAPGRCSALTIRDFRQSKVIFDPGNQWPMRSLACAVW